MSLWSKRKGWLHKGLALAASFALVIGTVGCGGKADDISSGGRRKQNRKRVGQKLRRHLTMSMKMCRWMAWS